MTSDESEGDCPPLDYRFTLANERTFLAWIRTALGLLAGGVAVQTLVQPFHRIGVRHTLAATCLVFAVVLAIGAYVHWKDVQERMEAGKPLTRTFMVPLLSVGIAIVAVMAAVAVFYR